MFNYELEKLRELYKKELFVNKYYNNRIDGDRSFTNYEEFKKIPFMDKQSIRETTLFDRTNTSLEDVFGIFSSSGTTGNKTFYVYSNNDKKVHKEFVEAFFDQLEINAFDIGGIMAPVDTGVMSHAMMWQFSNVGAGFVNCTEPSPQNIVDIVANVPVTVIATRPNVASSIMYFPELIKKAQDSKVNKLTLGGGFLSNERRKIIESVWNAECYNCFGMSEVFGPMAAECKEKNGLHFLNQYLMIEILDPITKIPVTNGKPGIAVYTTLWEKGFPLLRYWTDDLMIIDNTPCRCGSPYPRLYYLGRLADSFFVDDKYIFPEQVENILFANNLNGEYSVHYNAEKYIVILENDETANVENAKKQLEVLFNNVNVEIELVNQGYLNYKGFGLRFKTK